MALREATETPEGFPLFDPAPQHFPEDAWVRPHEAAIRNIHESDRIGCLLGSQQERRLLLALARKQ